MALHHAVIAVENLELAAARFDRLGFTVDQTVQRPLDGATAYLIPIGNQVLELRSAARDDGPGQALTQFLRERGDGVYGLGLRNDRMRHQPDETLLIPGLMDSWISLEGARLEATQRALSPSLTPGFHLWLTSPLAMAKDEDAGPAVADAATQALSKALAGTPFFSDTRPLASPQNLLAPTDHANGVRGIWGASGIAADPMALARGYRAFLSGDELRLGQDLVDLRFGMATLTLMSPIRFIRRYRGMALPSDLGGLRVLTLQVHSLTETARMLTERRMRTSILGHRIVIDPEHTGGPILELVEV